MKYTGRVYKRGPGNYQAIVNYKDEEGKYRTMRKTIHGKKELADEYLRQWLADLEQPKFQATDQSLGEWLLYWVDSIAKKDLERNTYESYRWEIEQHIIPMIGHAPLADLQPIDVQKFYDYKSENGKLKKPKLDDNGNSKSSPGLSNRSVTYIHSILNQALTKAVDLEMIEKNPCDKVKPGKKKKQATQDIVFLSKEQLITFLEESRGHRDYALIFTAAYTGARQSELLGLRWEDILWDEKCIRIQMTLHRNKDKTYEHRPRTKNLSSTRTITVTNRVIAVLRTHEIQQKQAKLAAGTSWKNTFNLVFTEPDGGPMDRRNQTQRFGNLAANLLKPVNGNQLTFHGLRHTHATILLSDGEYINVVSERLGHADVETTLKTYGHVLPKKREDAAERFDRLLSSEN